MITFKSAKLVELLGHVIEKLILPTTNFSQRTAIAGQLQRLNAEPKLSCKATLKIEGSKTTLTIVVDKVMEVPQLPPYIGGQDVGHGE